MKAGTSSLFTLLTQHPALCQSWDKEPEFFSINQNHRLDVDRYEDLFEFDPSVHKYCIEASTGYTKYPENPGVPMRIKEYGINPLLIYIVRDPIARTQSHLNYAHINNYDWGSDDLLGLYATAFSMYYTQMREYLQYFGDTSRYLIVDFDDIKAKPEVLAQEVFEWLDLDPFSISLEPPRNQTPPRSEAELALVRSPIHKIRHIVPLPIRQGAKRLLRTHGTSATKELKADQTDRLREWLQSDMIAFGEAFNFPVVKWGFTAP